MLRDTPSQKKYTCSGTNKMWVNNMNKNIAYDLNNPIQLMSCLQLLILINHRFHFQSHLHFHQIEYLHI